MCKQLPLNMIFISARKTIYTLVFTFFFILQYAPYLFGQCTGNVTLTSQSEVNAFACSNFTGNLTITDDNDGVDNIVDLTPIFNNTTAGLNVVDGDLRVFNSDFLLSLDGLQGLTDVGGTLELSFNNILNDISYFPNLQTVGGDLSIFSNDIVSFTTFDNLSSIGNSLSIGGGTLVDIPDFPQLTSVPTQFNLNGAFTEVDGFNNLVTVGLLGINGSNLQTITGFDNLTTVIFSLLIRDSPQLTTIDAFHAVTSAAQIQYLNLPSLVSVPDFSNLVDLGGFEFANSGDLLNIFSNIFTIDFITIRDSDISSIDDIFPDLQIVTNYLAIFDNPNLVSIDAFGSLTSIASLEVTDNMSIDCCDIIPLAAITTGNIVEQNNGGNICAFFDTVLNSPPSISCPVDITANAASGQTTANVSVTVPTVAYDCELVSFTADALDENGATVFSNVAVVPGVTEIFTLPIGINTITFTVTANNTMTDDCSYEVTVEDASIPCFGIVSLTTQAAVDAFDCTVFDGTLRIVDDGTDPITDLSALSNMTAVNTRLLIQNNLSLTSLNGLESLITVGTNLDIVGNTALSDLSALDNLESVNGNLVIGNITAQDLSFNSLQSVGGLLQLTNNDDLVDLTGFNSVTSLGALNISFNDALLDVSGLQNLNIINDGVVFTGNLILGGMSGFGSLTDIQGDFTINTGLWSNGFPFLGMDVMIGGDLSIGSTSISDISNLEFIGFVGGDLNIANNFILSDCCIVPNVPIGGVVILNNNDTGCDDISEIDAGVPMLDCPFDITVDLINDPSGTCIAQVNIVHPIPTDDCGVSLLDLLITDPDGNISSGVFSPGTEVAYDLNLSGDWLFEFVASDALEQSVSCITLVSVQDNTAPVWDDPSGIISITGICGLDDADLIANANAPTSTDACGVATVSFEISTFLGCGNSEVVTYTYETTDDAGNVNPINFIVEIALEDNDAPILDGVIPDVTINCSEPFPAIPTITANDVCQGDVSSDIVESVVIINGDCTTGGFAETQEFTWTVTDDCGNTATENWMVTVINDFVADLGPDENICESNGIVLGPIPGGDTYVWSTGETSPTIEVFDTGLYSVIVTSTNGCCAMDEIMITVNDLPDVIAEGGILDCSGNGVQLMGGSTTANVSYFWTGPSGYSSDVQNPIVFEGGEYTLVVSTVEGCESAQTVIVDQDIDVPDIMVSGGVLDCQNFEVSLMGNSTTAGVSYSWTGPNGFTSSDQNPTVENPGDYVLEILASNGCINTATAQVLEDLAQPDIMIGGGVLDCQNFEVSLMGSSATAGVSYSWTGPNGFTSSDQNPIVENPGDYVLEILAPNGCINSATAQVLEDLTQPDIMIEGGVIDCENPEISLMGSSTTAGVSYSWTGPNGFTSSDQNPTINLAGEYTLTVTGPNACTNFETIEVLEDNEVPNVFISEELFNCIDRSVDLAVISDEEIVSVEWSGPMGFSSNEEVVTVDALGSYSVTVSTSNGCNAVETYALGDIFTYTADITTTDAIGSEGGIAEIVIEGGTEPFTILWDNGDMGSMTMDLSVGTHIVTITDGLACSQEFEFEIFLSTNTHELELLSKISSYPNPVSDVLTVSWDKHYFLPTVVEIFDAKGVKLDSKNIINQESIQLNMSRFNYGFYLIRIRNSKELVTQRIFKY